MSQFTRRSQKTTCPVKFFLVLYGFGKKSCLGYQLDSRNINPLLTHFTDPYFSS